MADLKGRDVIIPASTWPDMTPPLAAGWPGKVTEYLTGGSQSRGGRQRRWGVMADVDIAKPNSEIEILKLELQKVDRRAVGAAQQG
eukprot:COSAG02_NODE_8280_length_2633_cov_0.894238_3_plen_86_part_00